MTDTSQEPTARRLSWIYPDRGTAWQRHYEEVGVWAAYREAAEALGLRMTLNKPEEVSVDASDATRPVIYLDGEPVTPRDTIFVTSLYSLPHQTQDVTNQLFLFTVLERAGFYLPIPPRLSYVGEDKTATALHLAGGPVPMLPSVRLPSGRESMTGHYDKALAALDYPIILKPAYWGMGLGISVVHNIHDLRGVVSLAAGSDTTMVAQPYIPRVREVRAYCVDGRAHTVLWGSKDGYCLVVAKTVGGRHERAFIDLPEELAGAVEHAASRLPAPYFTLDFVSDGEKYWISEIELDGAIGFGADDEQNRIAHELVTARFRAYLAGHARWIADGRPAPLG